MLRTPVDGTRRRILTRLGEPDTAERGLTADDIAAGLGIPLPVALTHLRFLTSWACCAPSAAATGCTTGVTRYGSPR